MAFLFLGFLQSFSVLKFCLHLWWFQLPVKKLLSKAASKGDTWTGIFIKFCRQLFSVIPLITHIKSWKNIQVESDAFLLLMNFPLPNNSTYIAKMLRDVLMLIYWEIKTSSVKCNCISWNPESSLLCQRFEFIVSFAVNYLKYHLLFGGQYLGLSFSNNNSLILWYYVSVLQSNPILTLNIQSVH